MPGQITNIGLKEGEFDCLVLEPGKGNAGVYQPEELQRVAQLEVWNGLPVYDHYPYEKIPREGDHSNAVGWVKTNSTYYQDGIRCTVVINPEFREKVSNLVGVPYGISFAGNGDLDDPKDIKVERVRNLFLKYNGPVAGEEE